MAARVLRGRSGLGAGGGTITQWRGREARLKTADTLCFFICEVAACDTISSRGRKLAKNQTTKTAAANSTEPISLPTPWPNANARLLGVGAGLPVNPLDRLAQFNAKDFERFTLEWADGYLKQTIVGLNEIQQRGGAGDKGRDIVVWLDPAGVKPRRWHLYQCKHYSSRLSAGKAAGEIAKVLYYTLNGSYFAPLEYWFVTHRGVTGDLQDLLDNPDALRAYVLKNWGKYCAGAITDTELIPLSDDMKAHIASFAFTIFRAKQPHDLINEHKATRYHLTVFGAPLINRPPSPTPPSIVAPTERIYVAQLYEVIAETLGITIKEAADFAHSSAMRNLFDRSRITFYSAEGLKELARDHMADVTFFDSLLSNFSDGLYHTYMAPADNGLARLRATIQAAQGLQLGAHVLEPHTTPLDREGVCHHLANGSVVTWCGK